MRTIIDQVNNGFIVTTKEGCFVFPDAESVLEALTTGLQQKPPISDVNDALVQEILATDDKV